jgi:hypothetical protein
MAWLAKLDTRARHWPKPLHWSYLALKWYLAFVGVVISIGLARQELAQHRVGLGLGLCAAIVFAGIKGVIGAIGVFQASGSAAPGKQP